MIKYSLETLYIVTEKHQQFESFPLNSFHMWWFLLDLSVDFITAAVWMLFTYEQCKVFSSNPTIHDHTASYSL